MKVEVTGMHVELFLPPEQVERENVFIPKLSHETNITEVQTGEESLENYDGVVTKNREFSLGIKTADCAPTCFSDDTTIGIAHIGWRGLCLGLIEKMIPYFDSSRLAIYVAPFLHSFEIQKDSCYERITQKFGERYIEQEEGKLIFRFKDAIASLLPPQTVYDARDTATDHSFPSNRRDGTKERFLTVVGFS